VGDDVWSSAALGAQIAEMLDVPAENVDPDADLIGQGLDSIRMMALAGRWRRQGVDVDFASLSANPTVTAWSSLLAASKPVPTPAPPATGVDSPPGDADSGTGPFPLAPMQHAMWVGRHDDQPLGGVAGHLYVEFDGGSIDPGRLQGAATALADRHPMLRVEFLPDATQRIRPASECPDFPVEVADLRDLEAAVVEERLAETREAKSHQQLDGTVFELTVSQLPDGSTRLHVDLDMQAADAMSYRTLISDLAALYRGTTLPDLGYTYREYRRQMAGTAPDDADRQWWSQRIAELPDPPRLPQPIGNPGDSHSTTRRWHWLDPATRDALFDHARARSVTPAMTVAASFANTVAHWSADARFLLNVPLFGREAVHPDVDGLVGDFTSSLLLDVDLTRAPTAAARAQAVQNDMRAAAAHSSYPGLSVLRDLSRHRGAQVLAPVVFTSALGLGELFSAEVTETLGRPVWIISQGPQVLLDAQVTEFDGGALVNWDVRKEMFAPGVVDAMFAHHVEELLRLAVGDAVGDAAAAWDVPAPVELPAEQAAVREEVNGRTAAGSGEALHHGFFRRAQADPDAMAVYAESGMISYGELRHRALAVASALRDRGVRPGDTVAVLGPKNAEQIPALLGILAAGGVYLPIGAEQPPDRAARIAAIGEARAALVTGTELTDLPVPAMTVRTAMQRDPGGFEFDSAATDPADLAYVVFTSGSTGEPKGVEVAHDAVMNTVEFLASHFGIGPGDRCLALLSLEADMSVLDIFGTLRAGGAIVTVDEADRRNPDTWASLIDTYRVTVLNLMPGSLEMLSGTAPACGDLSSLRVVATGGDWVRPELAHRLRARASELRFVGLGGATETAIHATMFEVGAGAALPAGCAAVPYGIPFPNISCRVVHATGDDCPDWVPGELWVSGRGIARGYRGRPELTTERFVEYDDKVWYRTGDLVRYWPDGTLEFLGRADHRVKVSGYRVELGEVEAGLRRVAGVAAAVAALVGSPEVLAAAVRADDPGLTVERVLDDLAELVPAHMVPRHLVLVDDIPYTIGGKIDRRAVVAGLSAGSAAGDAGPGHRNPSTPLQSALAAIVGDVLGVADGGVGIDDDFFTLGGDSVLATAAIARIRNWLDTPEAIVGDIFAARTVAALADRLTAREPEPGRLDQVAEVYQEVTQMDAADVLAAVAEP
jgi:mycobactin phenyloxazoline synthetase